MKNLPSKIENAILIACGLGLFIITLWNLVRVFSNLVDYSNTQVFDTILLTCILLIFQLGIVGVVYANKKF
jgi:hypothetical protein